MKLTMKKAVTYVRKPDPIMAAIIERVGACRMAYGEATFEARARAIVFQQLSTKAASTIYGRFSEAAGGAVTPEAINNLSVGEMRRAGLSKQKISYIRDLAGHALSGSLELGRTERMSDEEGIVMMTGIKGIGLWTAHMFLIFALRRPNILATGDLRVQTAIKKAYRKRKMPTPKDIEKIAKAWHPYCSLACLYLS